MNSLCTQHAHMHTVSMCRNTHKAHLSSSSLYTCLLFLIMHKHLVKLLHLQRRSDWNEMSSQRSLMDDWTEMGQEINSWRCRGVDLLFAPLLWNQRKRWKKITDCAQTCFAQSLKKKERKDFIKNVTQSGFMWCTASLFEFTPDIRPGNNCQLTIKSNNGHPDVCINETVHELLLLFQEVSPA